MKEIRHLKTIKNKRNLNTKWLLLQNDQNADTTLLHSHDEMFLFIFSFLYRYLKNMDKLQSEYLHVILFYFIGILNDFFRELLKKL